MQAIGMAFNREGFKNRIEEYLTGAIHEYLAARIGEAIGMTEYIAHWDNETDRLLNAQLSTYFLTASLKFNSSYVSRKKAYDEVASDMRGKEKICLSIAAAHVKQILTRKNKPSKIKKANYHPEEWFKKFWEMAEECVQPEMPIEIED